MRVSRNEMAAVGALLEAADLPPLPSGIPLSNVLVGLEDGSVIGVVALEVEARHGLTLWVAVSAEHRGKGLGTSLMRSLLTRTQELGLRELFAVTRNAAQFFAKLGFSPISHDAVPSGIRFLRPFRDQCDDSTQIMRLELQTRI
jgi:amino-acid N-acetyltransferase